MTSPSKSPVNDQDCIQLENIRDHVTAGSIPEPVTGGPSRKTMGKLVSEVSRLSTISEQEPGKPVVIDPSSHDPLGGSSFSVCSDRFKNNSSSHFSSDDSYQPDTGDDCAGLVLACLHCRFYELMVLLPDTCERAVSRCFPSFKYVTASSERDQLQQGMDCWSCRLELDCNFCNSCQDTAELIELAMEISEMALMKHRGLFELLEAVGGKLLHSKLQSCESRDNSEQDDSATASTRIAIETMLEELAPNLWEDDLDRLVDFGHIVSPELEMRVLPALLYGEAVNIDMSLMVYVAHQRGLLTAEEKDRIIQCMLGLELPVWHQDCSLDMVQKSLSERLKHSAGSLRMPLPIGLGRAEIFHEMIEDNILCRAYQKWTDELASSGNI